MNGICRIYQLGQVEYQKALDLQQKLANAIANGSHPPTLLLLEHPHTYTLGRQAKTENLLWSSSELEQRHIAIFWTDRGGDITYHGPGQLVGYPLLPLGMVNQLTTLNEASNLQPDYVAYLRKLEQTMIITLANLGIDSHPIEGMTGVWVSPIIPGEPGNLPPMKIASIGVKVDARGVSRHGFALNVNPDMRYWQGLIPCGLDGCQMVSLNSLLDPLPTMQKVVEVVSSAFAQVFGYHIEIGTPGELNQL